MLPPHVFVTSFPTYIYLNKIFDLNKTFGIIRKETDPDDY